MAGSRLLVAFLFGVAVWIVGNELPTWFGPVLEGPGLMLLATASVTAAAFLHFALVFCGRNVSRPGLAVAYGLGLAASLLSVVRSPGAYLPFADVTRMAVPNAVGWTTSLVWGLLAGAGEAVLVAEIGRRHGLARRQVAAVAASSAWGLLSMSGYAVAALDLPVYPWPLLLLPAYPVVLVYGILRYQVFVANAWARRALAWSLLTGAALGVVALVPLLPLEGAPGRMASGALVAVVCLGLAGPARRLAMRAVYPGGTASAADLLEWRATLGRAEDAAGLASAAAGLLVARLGVAVGVAVDGAAPPAPGVWCRRGETSWWTELVGWDAAPPGPRHLTELFGTVLADEAARLERAVAAETRERERQTEARLAELGALAATVAHDVRNPLNVIGMAAAGAAPEVRQEIAAQVARIARLSRDLLDYAKPWGVETVELDLGAHVSAALRRWPEVAMQGLERPVVVLADPMRLDQALANLLENARATGAATAVEVEAGADAVRLHVCDAGPGVDPAVRARMFAPFVSRTAGGTGLGLAIVARIMAAHGGRVALTERAGWSTCVTLEFRR